MDWNEGSPPFSIVLSCLYLIGKSFQQWIRSKHDVLVSSHEIRQLN